MEGISNTDEKIERLWLYLNNLQNALNKVREAQELLKTKKGTMLNRFKLGELNAFINEIEKALNTAENCLKDF